VFKTINDPNPNGTGMFNSISGLAISPDGKQVYAGDWYYDGTAMQDTSELYIFDIQQSDNNFLERRAGGLYTAGNPAPGGSLNRAEKVTASKVGHCPQ